MQSTKQAKKQQILNATLAVKKRNEEAIATLKDRVCLEDYAELAFDGQHGKVWTAALQKALWEHEIVVIPQSEEIYWLDSTVVIPSNRRIEAVGATVRLVPEYPYIMLCNEHVHDGTDAPIEGSDKDRNISIHGGCWEESCQKRGARRFREADGTFKGVQTCMLFNNLEGLTMTDVTFSHTMSFCVQVGDIKDGVFENFFFISCYADGLHINGNSEGLYVRNFRGHVGDDLVALNMYDWIGSSINYGPAKTVFVEDIHSAPDSRAKAMRLQPGIFFFKDGTAIDCSLEDMYFRHLSGIYEYKLYFQSPPYALDEKPEGGGAGSADGLFFEDVSIIAERNVRYPINTEITGNFGMFFANSNIGYLSLENVHYTVGEDLDERTYLVAIGPMSWRRIKNGVDVEVFDPYITATLDTLEMQDIFVNGQRAESIEGLVKIIEFDDVNGDGFSSGKGRVNNIIFNGKKVTLN